MWRVSELIALAPLLVVKDHFFSRSGRSRAIKALSAPLLSPRSTLGWLCDVRANWLMNELCRRDFIFAVKPMLKYLNKNYCYSERVRCLKSHYQFCTQTFTPQFLKRIHFENGITLARFNGKSGSPYHVALQTHSVSHNEGEWVLRLQNSNGTDICLVIFTVGSSAENELRIEIGAIQGARRQHPTITQAATKDFFSTRPMHLLMAIMYGFAHTCKIRSIVCVSTTAQVNQNDDFTNLMRTDYNHFWEELGGRLRLGFYVLPPELSHKAGRKDQNKHPRRHRHRQELRQAVMRTLSDHLLEHLLRFSTSDVGARQMPIDFVERLDDVVGSKSGLAVR